MTERVINGYGIKTTAMSPSLIGHRGPGSDRIGNADAGATRAEELRVMKKNSQQSRSDVFFATNYHEDRKKAL